MKLRDFIKNNKKYIIILSMTIVLMAVVVLVLGLFSADDKADLPESESGGNTAIPESTGIFVETTPTDGDIDDPENKDLNENEGNSINAGDLTMAEGRSNGIDVSKWQGKIDWKAVKESGIEFAFIRVGYRGENAVIYKDENAEYNIQQAQKNGILVGVYFFSTAVSEDEAVQEAEWVLQFIEGYKISYPVVYDCEGFKSPSSRMYSVTAEKRTNNAQAFLSRVSSEGYDTMLYGARNELQDSACWNISLIETDHKVWVAQYSDISYPEQDKPDYNGRYDAWQFTNMGQIDGVSGNVDMVVCYFTRDEAAPKNPSVIPVVAKEPLSDGEVVYTKVNDRVTAKELTNLRTAPTTKSDIVATLKNGEYVTRTGISSKGWSMLEYNGRTVYAISSYLTNESATVDTQPEGDIVSGVTFQSHNDSVTAKILVNLRSLPSTVSGEIVGTLKSGDFLERTAISTQGWSRLIYNGQAVYAVSSYLSTEVIEQTTEAPVDERYVFEPVDENVTAKIETNLRSEPTTNGSEVIYTLKNGEYVKRVGINNVTGWSKLEYNGIVVYAVSSYLTVQSNVE